MPWRDQIQVREQRQIQRLGRQEQQEQCSLWDRVVPVRLGENNTSSKNAVHGIKESNIEFEIPSIIACSPLKIWLFRSIRTNKIRHAVGYRKRNSAQWKGILLKLFSSSILGYLFRKYLMCKFHPNFRSAKKKCLQFVVLYIWALVLSKCLF